jgi:DNA polymerase III epsilon subunit-like protein
VMRSDGAASTCALVSLRSAPRRNDTHRISLFPSKLKQHSRMANKATQPHTTVLVFDTETSGLPVTPRFGEYYAIDDFPKYAGSRLVQIAWQVVDLQSNGEVVREYQTLISPQGSFRISKGSTCIHGITQEHAESAGIPIEDMLQVLNEDLSDVDILAAHNLFFDIHILASEMARAGPATPAGLLSRLTTMPSCCTMRTTTGICDLVTSWGSPKWPRLVELHRFLFDDSFENAHDALADVRATSKCLVQLLQTGLLTLTERTRPSGILQKNPTNH